MFSSQLGVELEKSAYFVSFVHTLNKGLQCYVVFHHYNVPLRSMLIHMLLGSTFDFIDKSRQRNAGKEPRESRG